MSSTPNQLLLDCPYVGLQPYTESEREYFFGREQDTETIAANLLTARLTLLYGASGVGKTSVLSAGVVPYLRALPNTLIVVFKTWQDQTFQVELMDAIARQIGDAKSSTLDPSLPLDEFLAQVVQQTQNAVLIIFDQFEEYFLYHPHSGLFDESLARAINRADLNANFLLALREDALSQLDRFEARIPNLMSNYLRLEHLNREGAINAIRKPLDVYNTAHPSTPPLKIEDALVDTLIQQVQTGRVMLGQGIGQGTVSAPTFIDRHDARIETPFMQMVLTRLWQEEVGAGSRILRLETLNRLGGAEKIVRTHLDAVMRTLAPAEREVCSSFFDRLVTPSGTKVAQSADDLVTYAGRPAERVMPILKKLADARVLRPIAPPIDKPQTARYEIFHDVLAPGILDWRGRYAERKRTRRWRLTLLGASLIVLVIGVLALVAVGAYLRATAAESQTQYLQREARAAESRRLALQSAVNREKNFPLSLLLGIEAYHSDNNLETQVNLFDALMSKSQLITVLPSKSGPIWSVALSPDGELLVAAGGIPPGIVVAPDIKFDNPLVAWDLKTSPPPSLPFLTNGRGVRAITFNGDGTVIVSGNVDGTITLWDRITLRSIGELPAAHKRQVNSLAFRPNENILASGSDDGTVIFWDVNLRRVIDQGMPSAPDQPVNAVAFSPDGRTLISGSGDGTVVIWDANAHRPIGQPILAQKSGVLSLAFNPNGESFVTGGKDNSILLWDATTRQIIGQPFIGHTGSVWGLIYNNNGDILVSSSQDRRSIAWDLNSHIPAFQPPIVQNDTVSSLARSRDDKLLVTGSWDGTIVLWDVDIESWIRKACKLANRNLTIEEWKQYFIPDESSYHTTCPDLPSPR